MYIKYIKYVIAQTFQQVSVYSLLDTRLVAHLLKIRHCH